MTRPDSRSTSAPPAWVTAADLLTLILMAGAILVAVHPITAGPLGLRIRAWPRLVLVSIVVAALRHAIVSSPSLPVRINVWRLAARARWPSASQAIPIAGVTRAMALLSGYAALVTMGPASGAPPVNTNQLLYWEMPLRWDAGWYVAIAKNGYEWRGSVNTQQNLNFFPAYPWLVRVAAVLVPLRNVPVEVKLAWTGTLLSIAAFACALIYIHKLVAGWLDADTARVATLLLATYPFSLFYSAVYSEALFLLAVAGAWYHLERSQNGRALVWGLLAGLTRPNGVLLTPVLIAIAFSRQRRNAYAYLAAFGPLAGMAIYSFVGYRLSGHPFIWAELQREAWSRTYQGLGRTLGVELSAIRDLGMLEYVAVRPFEAFNLAATLLACSSLWPVSRRLGFAAGLFVALNTLVPLLNGGLAGMGRYTSLLFPMFVWLALCQSRGGASLLVGCFGAGQALLAALFFTGRPVI